MKTIIIQIGNSDDKLTQIQWHDFVKEVDNWINIWVEEIHFFGCPAAHSPWQNAAWIAEIKETSIRLLLEQLIVVRKHYRQNSIAVTVGETSFV